MRRAKKVLMAIAGLAALAITAALVVIGPRNVYGMLRYDTRREGALRVGDVAPDVTLTSLDGKTPVQLASYVGEKPLVLVFGSFT
jgi:hypothetical protein